MTYNTQLLRLRSQGLKKYAFWPLLCVLWIIIFYYAINDGSPYKALVRHYYVMPKYRKVLAAAASRDIGLRETSKNESVEINQWADEINVPHGQPWCLTAVQHWAKLAALELQIKDPLRPDTANVYELWQTTPSAWKISENSAEVGDLLLIESGPRKRHCGVIIGRVGSSYITVEGNAALEPLSDDNQVVMRLRETSHSDILGILRIR